MNKENEIMKKITLPIYRSTFNRMVEFKDSKEWTHDEAINKLIDCYEADEEMRKGWKNEKVK